MKVTEEQLCSLQVSTSKPDVYVRLCVLDKEEEVASAVGKGHVVIPAYVFHKDPALPGEEAAQPAPAQNEPKRSSSRTCEYRSPLWQFTQVDLRFQDDPVHAPVSTAHSCDSSHK